MVSAARKLAAPIVLLLTLAAACLVFPHSMTIRVTDRAGVAAELPDRVGDWQGREILFCTNPSCQQEVLVSDADAGATCPACGSPLHVMSVAEQQLLPADTVLVRKRYDHSDGTVVIVSLVFSGRYRSSIHRPEVCLVGQGREIVSTLRHEVALPGRPPVRFTVLNMLHHATGATMRPGPLASYFAYCFIGPRHETPSHYVRMFWMAVERVFHGETSKWAYLAITGRRDPRGTEHLRRMDDLVARLYPEIVTPP